MQNSLKQSQSDQNSNWNPNVSGLPASEDRTRLEQLLDPIGYEDQFGANLCGGTKKEIGIDTFFIA